MAINRLGWLRSGRLGTAFHFGFGELLLTPHIGRIFEIEQQRRLICKDFGSHAADSPAFVLVAQNPQDFVGVALAIVVDVGPGGRDVGQVTVALFRQFHISDGKGGGVAAGGCHGHIELSRLLPGERGEQLVRLGFVAGLNGLQKLFDGFGGGLRISGLVRRFPSFGLRAGVGRHRVHGVRLFGGGLSASGKGADQGGCQEQCDSSVKRSVAAHRVPPIKTV
ncbi:MAG TPA: hypothetical protein PK867_28005 [Pirellulales bacterium]|nr:hypothetical protein [Pirellulales bacterium]